MDARAKPAVARVLPEAGNTDVSSLWGASPPHPRPGFFSKRTRKVGPPGLRFSIRLKASSDKGRLVEETCLPTVALAKAGGTRCANACSTQSSTFRTAPPHVPGWLRQLTRPAGTEGRKGGKTKILFCPYEPVSVPAGLVRPGGCSTFMNGHEVRPRTV